MSRIANKPITIPPKTEVSLTETHVLAKGAKGQHSVLLNAEVDVVIADGQITFKTKNDTKFSNAMSGTLRALVQNLVTGVHEGFEKKLMLVGVGYRAQAQGKSLNLTLGYSHPVNYPIPTGITVETPQPTEIVVKGVDKQLVGQVAADIRAYRSPEPYKGKGIRYAGEVIILKDAKKK